MSIKKPEVVAWMVSSPPCLKMQPSVQLKYPDWAEADASLSVTALIKLSDYESLQAEVEALVEALEQIERWDGFPSTGKTWEGSGEPVSYGAAFGSNGERDFMRGVARAALTTCRNFYESKEKSE